MSQLELFWALFGNVLIALWFGLTMFAAIAGLWALLNPDSFILFNRRLSTWVGMEKAPAASAQVNFKLERPFYRYHLITGPLIVLASVYVLYEAIFVLSRAQVGNALGVNDSMLQIWTEILVDAAFGWIYISGFIAFLVGIVVTIRPSYLKGIEVRMNTWVDTENTTSVLDKKLNLLDEWVCEYPRLFGIISLLGSVAVAWAMMHFGYLS
jgi:hypothetical protein